MISLAILISQLLVFTLVAMLVHYASPRIGMAPLLFMLAAIIGILNIIELNLLTIELSNGLVLRPGGHVLVPVALMIILLLYVVNGTRTAQISVLGIMGVQALVLVILLYMTVYIQFTEASSTINGTFADKNIFNLGFIRAMVASLIAFVADMLIIIIVYQGINNWFQRLPKWIAPGVALVVALWADAVLFNLLAFVGTPSYQFQIPSDVIVKTGAGLLMWLPMGLYLTRFAPQMNEFIGPNKRRTLAILFHEGSRNLKVETLENELRISRRIYTQLTQNIEEIFWLMDVEEGRFIYVSPAYERITKYSVEPLYERIDNLLTIIHPDDRNRIENNVLDFITSEGDSEFRIVSPNQVVRWLRARAFPIKDERGVIIRYAGIAEDITERKRLTEQEFELALARERMQILQHFISDASHDLKTPLSAMTLKIDLLERIEDETRRTQLRSEIKERANHLSNLINDLFTLSHIESQDNIEMTSVDLNMISKQVIGNTRPLALDKGLDFNIHLTEQAMDFVGNAKQITRVVSNMVSNAIRYTQQGSIMVSTSRTDDSVILRVTDTGIGIPEEQQAHVFERFFRTPSARDTQDGTGLGLAIAKAITERHHGTLTVESVVGTGSTFTLTLPLTQLDTETKHDTKRITQEIRALPKDS